MTKHDYSNKVREREYNKLFDHRHNSTKNEMTKLNGNGLTNIVELGLNRTGPEKMTGRVLKLVLVIYRFTSYVPGNGYW